MLPELDDDHAGEPFDPHPETLRQMTRLTLVTESGPLDVCVAPAGFPDGYDDLSRHAVTVLIGATDVAVASLSDVIRSTRAAGRPTGIVAFPDREAHARTRGDDLGETE